MEAQSLVSHQHSWWFSCFSLQEKLARSHNNKTKRLEYSSRFVFIYTVQLSNHPRTLFDITCLCTLLK